MVPQTILSLGPVPHFDRRTFSRGDALDSQMPSIDRTAETKASRKDRSHANGRGPREARATTRGREWASTVFRIPSFIHRGGERLAMSSSFPVARFPALPLSREKEADPLYKEAVASRSDEPSDDALIARICTNDNDALGMLFRRYARLVWSIAERIVRDKAEADDLVQEVFLLIRRRAPAFDSAKGTARSLIVHMTYQRAISRRRYLNARHCQAPKEMEEHAANLAAPSARLYDESIEAHFGRECLRKALEEMSEDQRETLRLYFFEGYTLDEIAARLGQSAANAKHHYYRGLNKLRKHMPKV